MFLFEFYCRKEKEETKMLALQGEGPLRQVSEFVIYH